MTIVIYNPNKEKGLRRAGITYGFQRFKPGRNEVSIANLKRLEEIPSFQDKLKRGAITIIGKDTEIKQGEEITELTAEEAFKVIACETSIKDLNNWSQKETKANNRKTVINAIQRQIRKIQDGEL